jgi:hypothetical protein
MMRRILSGVAMVFICSFAGADDSNWRFFAAAGVANGGDTIAAGTIATVGTNQVLPFEIRPGTGTQFRMGADYRFIDRLTLQGSIGHSVTDPMGMDGSLEFTVTPIELLAFVNLTGGLRLGGGARKSYAEMTGSGKAAGWSGLGTYTSSQGSVVELQYLFSASNANSGYKRSQFGITLRLVTESFTHDSVTVNGDHREIGLALYY